MKDRWARGSGVIALGVVAPLLSVGCDNTAVKLADVPQVQPTKAEPPKKTTRIPKNATFSPPVLPAGNEAK